MASKHARDLKAVKQVRAEKADRIQELWDLEAKEDRQLEQAERDEIHELTKSLRELETQQEEIEANLALEKEVKEASAAVKPEKETVEIDSRPTITKITDRPVMKSLGEQFVESKAYLDAFGPDAGPRSGEWKTGSVELNTKSTILGGGTAGGYAPYTQYVPGVVPVAAESPSVASVMPSNNATSPVVSWFRETVATNAAAGVAESSQKPISTFDFEAKTSNLKKIATFMPVADEMLEDAPSIQTYLNQRLGEFIRFEEDRQILRGKAANDLVGFCGNYSTNGVGSASITATAGTTFYRSLLNVMNKQRGSSFLNPTALFMHPTQFGSAIGFADANAQFYVGGPVLGEYGAGGPANTNQLDRGGLSMWGVPVIVTSQLKVGTMLLGNFSEGAALWRRGGINVSASNSHGDFFRTNLTAIRAEERLALTIYRPSAFTVIKW